MSGWSKVLTETEAENAHVFLFILLTKLMDGCSPDALLFDFTHLVCTYVASLSVFLVFVCGWWKRGIVSALAGSK